jgi:hypothetical protein
MEHYQKGRKIAPVNAAGAQSRRKMAKRACLFQQARLGYFWSI